MTRCSHDYRVIMELHRSLIIDTKSNYDTNNTEVQRGLYLVKLTEDAIHLFPRGVELVNAKCNNKKYYLKMMFYVTEIR